MENREYRMLLATVVLLVISFAGGWIMGESYQDMVSVAWYEDELIPHIENEWRERLDRDIEELNTTWAAQFMDAEDAWGLAMGSGIRSSYETGYSEGYWDGLRASLTFNVTEQFSWITEDP